MEKFIRYIFNVLALVLIFAYFIFGILIPVVRGEDSAVISDISYQYFQGNGTEKSPYQIRSSLELLKLSELVNSGSEFRNIYFKQTKDLNIESIEYLVPIGQYNSNHYFYGIYDGAGHNIYNLNIKGEGTNVALFGQLGGTVKNLGIESGVIQGACIGSIASHAAGNEAKIINCYNKATLKASGRAGGIADNFGSGYIINCWNEGSLEAPETGGISSYTAGVIYNSYCTQESIVNQYFGGTMTFLAGRYSLSKSDLVQKMNSGIKSASTTFELKEDTFMQWEVNNESIILEKKVKNEMFK